MDWKHFGEFVVEPILSFALVALVIWLSKEDI